MCLKHSWILSTAASVSARDSYRLFVSVERATFWAITHIRLVLNRSPEEVRQVLLGLLTIGSHGLQMREIYVDRACLPSLRSICFECLCTKMRLSLPGLGGAPERQRRLDSILQLVRTVLYFPFEEMLKRLEVHFEKWLNPWAQRNDGTLLRDDKKTPSLNIRTLRQAVEGLGVTLRWQGSQWILYGRGTEALGHSIKTERDALELPKRCTTRWWSRRERMARATSRTSA
jgi:hypothetical protein